MKNHLIRIFILLCIVTHGLTADEKPETSEEDTVAVEEEKETYIEELVEDYDETLGFFVTYRDPESNQIFLKITKEQLKSEFIYFAHVINGVASTGKVKGSYTDEGIFKIEKDFNNLRFSRVLTNFSFTGFASTGATLPPAFSMDSFAPRVTKISLTCIG